MAPGEGSKVPHPVLLGAGRDHRLREVDGPMVPEDSGEHELVGNPKSKGV